MPCLGMLPTAKGMPVPFHGSVFFREHTTLRAANGFQRVERFCSRQLRRRASPALVYRITDNPENNDNPEH